MMSSAPNNSLQRFTPSSSIQKLSFLLIRPPRHAYNPDILAHEGHDRFIHCVEYIPFELSLYFPKVRPRYFILYLHGNSSSRVEALTLLDYLPDNVGLATFDFDGCGNRTGKWVTLGLNQSKQVNATIKFLRTKGFTIVGWGRSMGAVSLLLSEGCEIMIVDSPFSSIRKVCKETAERHKPWYIPNCLVNCLFPCLFSVVRRDIKSKTHEDIDQLQLKRYMKNHSHKAIMFLTADKDEIIDFRQSKKLFDQFEGTKEIMMFRGSHNSVRDRRVYNKCFEFINERLRTLLGDQLAPPVYVRAATIETGTVSFQDRFNTPI